MARLSVLEHGVPSWIADARFGIWSHWGPQSVAQSGDWYARHLYGMQEGSAEWERKRATRQSAYHRERFGEPSEVGFKDLLPLWRAQHFDPDALIAKFHAAGARYFMSMGVHCDNFALWDSKVHPWNSARVGPERDIVGAWERAAREAGMPFALSFHNNWTWRWFDVAHGADTAGTPHDGRLTDADGAGLWWEGLNPQDLYLQPRESAAAPLAVRQKFWAMAREATARYRPDMIYFDDLRLPFDLGSEAETGEADSAGWEFLQWYHDQASTWDLPFAHGIASIKRPHPDERRAVLLDSERRQLDHLDPVVWQFDTSDGEWFDNLSDDEMFHQRKTVEHVLHTLVDVVSKNGALLLNMPQRADGTLDARADELLAGIGQWMSVADEAIHRSRPWKTYGEGTQWVGAAEGYNDAEDAPYTSRDLRFTTRDGILYVFAMRWPDDGMLSVTSLNEDEPSRVDHAELLGHGPVRWERDARGLHVRVPDRAPTAPIGVLKLMGRF